MRRVLCMSFVRPSKEVLNYQSLDDDVSEYRIKYRTRLEEILATTQKVYAVQDEFDGGGNTHSVFLTRKDAEYAASKTQPRYEFHVNMMDEDNDHAFEYGAWFYPGHWLQEVPEVTKSIQEIYEEM